MQYSIEIVTAESVYPVTLTEAKTHLGVSHSDHDTRINTIIAAACRLAESITWVTLGSRTLRMHMDYFEDCIIPRTPISAITSIKYYDLSNTLLTLASTEYSLDLTSFPARVYFYSTPSTYVKLNAVQINMTAGHATIGDVDSGIKQAILMVIADMYDQRGSIIHGASSAPKMDYERLFMSFRKNYHF
jgi:uncharacterized phiE125 gp8 family phage protein